MSLSFDNVSWVNTARTRSAMPAQDLFIAVQKNGKDAEGNDRVCNCLKISESIMDKARLRLGDKVLVGVVTSGDSDYLAVKMDDECGYKLSSSSKSSGNAYVKFCYSVNGSGDLAFPKGLKLNANKIVYERGGFFAEIDNGE